MPEVSDADSQAGPSSNCKSLNWKSLADGNKVSHMDRLVASKKAGAIPPHRSSFARARDIALGQSRRQRQASRADRRFRGPLASLLALDRGQQGIGP